MENIELQTYASDLIGDVQIAREPSESPEIAFTTYVLDQISGLIDYGEPVIGHCRITNKKGDVTGEIHAYSESTNGEILYLFYTDYNSLQDIRSKNNSESQPSVNRPQGFYQAALRYAHDQFDHNTTEYNALKFIHENYSKYDSIMIVVLSNYMLNNLSINRFRIDQKPVHLDVWDLKKLFRFTHSMSDHMAIDIDFDSAEYNQFKIPYIQMESPQFGYQCIQAMLPAKLLYRLYEKYNTNLLYSNIRYFLGLKGTAEKNPNPAMLETLRKENEMFLAYNNGITALAKGIEGVIVGEKTDVSDSDEEGDSFNYISMGVLKKIIDFRIINGGQTTAVIFNARKNNKNTTDPTKKVNLRGVYVQMKLIISDSIDNMAGKITMSSNFQNKTKVSDFSVSNNFNIELEKLSRMITVTVSGNQKISWFFERLRGQYDETRKTKTNKYDRELFESQYPKKNKFTKEEIAKVRLSWEQLPFEAVKGATTAYSKFMKDMSKNPLPDEKYFSETMALLIIYRFLLSRPENRMYGNAKATVAAYAMSMLQYLMPTLDLGKIWIEQKVPDNLKIFLNTLSDKIFSILDNRTKLENKTILSYGKTKNAYDLVRSEINVDITQIKNLSTFS